MRSPADRSSHELHAKNENDEITNWVEAVYEGDLEAYSKLFLSLRPYVTRIIIKKLYWGVYPIDSNDLEDYYCEILMKALLPKEPENRWRKERGASFKTWLYWITSNYLKDKNRKNGSHEVNYGLRAGEEEEEEENDDSRLFIPEPQDTGPSLESVIEARNKEQIIRECLASLDEREREIAILRAEFENNAETVRALGITEYELKKVYKQLLPKLKKVGIGR